MLTHACWTRKGDSGSPLIIQPFDQAKNCYLIGIHIGKLSHQSQTKAIQ